MILLQQYKSVVFLHNKHSPDCIWIYLDTWTPGNCHSIYNRDKCNIRSELIYAKISKDAFLDCISTKLRYLFLPERFISTKFIWQNHGHGSTFLSIWNFSHHKIWSTLHINSIYLVIWWIHLEYIYKYIYFVHFSCILYILSDNICWRMFG